MLLPSSIEIIDTKAFFDLEHLNIVTFSPDSNLKSIKNSAFYHCVNLKTINLPKSIRILEESCFYHCTSLTGDFNFPLIIDIPDSAFENCLKITSFTFSNLSSIGKNAFSGCESLSSINFGEYLEFIGESAFSKTSSLQDLSLPPTLQTISSNSFNLSGIQTVTFGRENEDNSQNTQNIIGFAVDQSEMTYLNDYAFYYATELHTIKYLPSTINQIGRYAFAHTALTEFTVPDSTKNISDYCFEGCSSLKKFNIPQSSLLEKFGYHVFDGCVELEEFIAENKHFTVNNQGLFTYDRKQLIKFPPHAPTQVFSLPDDVTMIGVGAFANCINLKTILIPEQKEFNMIGQNAFENCTNLKTINIPATVTSILQDAFLGCKSIQCGQIISINETMKEKLVEEAKFPSIGLKECYNTHCVCDCFPQRNTLSIIFLGILYHK